MFVGLPTSARLAKPLANRATTKHRPLTRLRSGVGLRTACSRSECAPSSFFCC